MTTLKTGARAKDPTYYGVETLMWTGVEMNAGIMCACLPLLRPLLNKFFPWFGRRSSRGVPTVPSCVESSTPTRSNNNQGGGNVILSKISNGRRVSRGSSEAGITQNMEDDDGIAVTRKVDIEEAVVDSEDDGWYRNRQSSQPTSSKGVL